ncbi:MscS Mechanosensitive ion channel [Thalassoporum mexicanum PCC 7367]|uniref:mechanosensitive ion channel family protein n=1 Tax=Thalassoporum mexicanum TaxID=3457544 RepID=UPI00029FB28B|nr:mechanosensitive ion channel family protein [Pseudanabaena sp. PCC 7367]AFY68520.1 MscS Mechanosensitive ion channel [Pseudanabaena sp. PCC 7367]
MEFLNQIIAHPQVQKWGDTILAEAPTWITFVVFILVSILVGKYTPNLVKALVEKFAPDRLVAPFEKLIEPLKELFVITGTFILVSMSLVWIRSYEPLYSLLKPFADLAVIASIAWLVSRFIKQLLRVYGIDIVRRMGLEVDELLLVFEAFINFLIGFVAILAFARSQNYDLLGVVASVGLVGIAIAFAAKQILEQLLSTIVLYLDRPFVPGDYIRLNSGQLGRVESIGLRSTKIRTLAKSTVVIVPNSTLVGMDIENVTMAKKVMVMLYLDFDRHLEDKEHALVQQVVRDSTNSLFGIDPGSTRITIMKHDHLETSRARVTFFILGSNENSLELRKRLLELANESMTAELRTYGIEFAMQDPTIYVESPVTI